MLFLFIAPLMAAEATGYAELRGSFSADVEGTPWQIVERVRPTLSGDLAASWSVEVTVEAIGAHGRWEPDVAYDLVNEQIGSVLASAECPFEAPGDRVSRAGDYLSVERMFLDYYGEKVDVRIGRQALNWGSSQMLNPTDMFAEVLVAEPWRERKGVNAARVNWALNGGGQITAVAAITDTLDQVRLGLRPTWNVVETDISPVASVNMDAGGQPEGFVGLDLRGQNGVGWWLEGGAHLREQEALPEVSIGLDYSLLARQGLLFGLQYTYDATGIADPLNYSLAARGTMLVPVPGCDAAAETFSIPEEIEPRFTIGQHYGLAWTRLAWDENWTLQASALMNLQDQSTFFLPSLGWTPGERLSLNLGAQILLGEGEFSPGVHVSRVNFGEGHSQVTVDFDGLIPTWSVYTTARFAL
jgi:hypothetical protein